MQKRSRRIVICTAAVLMLVAVVVWYPSTLSPNLLLRAHKVADVQAKSIYNWVSSHELIVRTSVPASAQQPLDPFCLEVVDARAHTRVGLSALTAAIVNHHHKDRFPSPYEFQRSPDGEWLEWVREAPTDRTIYWVSARIDGTGYHDWNALNSYPNSWWIDGTRWISEVDRNNTKCLVLRDLAHPTPDHFIPLSSPAGQELIRLAKQPSHGAPINKMPAMYGIPTQNNREYGIYYIPAGLPYDARGTQVDTVRLPAGGFVWEFNQNTQGTRLMLVVSDPQVPAFAEVLHRHLPLFKYPPHPVERIYIYCLGRKEMSEAGWVEAASMSTLPSVNPTWLRDGKHIQFQYQNAVYTLDVE